MPSCASVESLKHQTSPNTKASGCAIEFLPLSYVREISREPFKKLIFDEADGGVDHGDFPPEKKNIHHFFQDRVGFPQMLSTRISFYFLESAMFFFSAVHHFFQDRVGFSQVLSTRLSFYFLESTMFFFSAVKQLTNGVASLAVSPLQATRDDFETNETVG